MIKLSLIHDGRQWVARADSWTARAESLEKLDQTVADIVRRTEKPSDGRQIKVKMHFDISVIPQWMRQYSNHYFNRLVTVDFAPEGTQEPVIEGA